MPELNMKLILTAVCVVANFGFFERRAEIALVISEWSTPQP
jgi:hypothetical protein